MILVKIYWNDDEKGEFTAETTNGEVPCSYYGPFRDIVTAISWMENDYPQDDPDVLDWIADEFEIPYHLLERINTPDSIHGDIPDEDIRTDDDVSV